MYNPPMRGPIWVLLLGAVGCGSGAGDDGSAPASAPPTATASEVEVVGPEDELTSLTNRYRVAQGRNALVDDASLRRVARSHSEDMALRRFFGHVNPDGAWPEARATLAGISWTAYAENLAGGQSTAAQAFADLLASPSHRSVIDDPGWTHMGCGYAIDPGAPLVHYWTQNFKRE